ncbi:MAG: O-antigen ligase family protein [Bacteroidia bacterium]|nr:O-antigen ligase family protein [Bacteroidia bacterium]
MIEYENLYTVKKTIFIEKFRSGYFSYLCAILAMIMMPIHFRYLPPIMILWGICWLLENASSFKNIWHSQNNSRVLFLAFLVYYIFEIAGLIYSNNIKLGLANVSGRLSLILFPLVLFYPGENIRKRVNFLLRIFAISCLAYLIACYGYALFRSSSFVNGTWSFNPYPTEYPLPNYFFGDELTVFQHPSYAAMYVIISIFIAFESWFNHSLKIRERILWLFGALFLITSLYFISSRAGMLAGIILVLFYFSMKLNTIKNGRFVLLGIFVLIIISIPLLRNNQRYGYLYDKIMHKETVGENIEEPRMIIWKSAFKIAKENVLFGVGVGDVRDELTKQYLKIGRTDMAEIRLNAHNQFIEVLLENGLIGLILFLGMIGIMIYFAIIQKSLLYGIFILLILILFTFETVLYRFAGVSFFSLFSFLLLQVNMNRGIPENQTSSRE